MPESSQNLGGRPTDFKQEYIRQAYILCRDDGYTMAKLAKLFSTTRVTIYNWMKNVPEFKAVILKGRDEYDCGEIEKALNKRATGFYYNETVKELVWIDDPKSQQPTEKEITQGAKQIKIQKLITTKRTRKLVVPDTKACEFWLCNRNPERWKKLKHVDLTSQGEKLIDINGIKKLLSVLEEKFGIEWIEDLKKSLSEANE